MNKAKRGRPRKNVAGFEVVKSQFDASIIKTVRGNDLHFNNSIFEPLKTKLPAFEDEKVTLLTRVPPMALINPFAVFPEPL